MRQPSYFGGFHVTTIIALGIAIIGSVLQPTNLLLWGIWFGVISGVQRIEAVIKHYANELKQPRTEQTK